MKPTIVLTAGAWLLVAALPPGFAAAQGAAASQGAPAAQSAPAAAASDQQPSDIVQATAQSILKDLETNREAYRKDPPKVGQLVDKYLLPHFDTEYAARLVLGQHWRTATPDQ